MTGVAVNVIGCPLQMAVVSVAISTDAVTVGVTLIVMACELAVAEVAHTSLDVNTHSTTSVAVSELFV